MLAAQDRPVWSQMAFATAEENFTNAAMLGIDATVFWPGSGEVPVSEAKDHVAYVVLVQPGNASWECLDRTTEWRKW